MPRVTVNSGGQQSEDWEEERWYVLELERVDRIEPKGSPGYQGQPRRNPRATLVWKLPETDEWLWDNFDLTVNSMRDGSPSTCKQLICALVGRQHLQEQTPWIDDSTLEFGFGPDAATDTPAGQIHAGVRIAARGKWGLDGKGNRRFNIEKYADPRSIQITAPPPPPSEPMLSPDGRYRWDGHAWIPAIVPTPPPVPTPAPVPVQGDLI